jgi:hypothetical protein
MKDIEYTDGELLAQSPSFFIKSVFGYIIAPHHYSILEHFRENQVTLDLAPRGSGKSRVGNIAYASWLVCNNPNARILILSDTDTHAVRFLSTIKSVLSNSILIEDAYGNIRGEQWSDHQIITALRTDKAITEASITALGMYSGAVTTGHYTHIFADDLDNFANTRTPGMRERSKLYWKTTVLPTLLPGGEIRVLGTRYHFDDLYNMFINELGYDTQIQPAIVDIGTPNERSIWEGFMPLHTRVIEGRKVKGLIEIRDGEPGSVDVGIGSLIFNLQYQNDVSLQKSGTIFKWDWFNFYDAIPPGLRIYILDIYRAQGVSFFKQVGLVLKKAAEWKPLKIGIESNAYQAALAQEVQRISLLPAMELSTSKDKVMRAQMRSGLVETGRVYVKASMHDFISELVLLDNTTGVDDQFDAFDLALTSAEGDVPPAPEDYFLPELAVVDG